MKLGDHAIRNGELISPSDAVLPITSREVQCNFSVYEALRVIEGKVVHLLEHLARLKESAELIHLTYGFSDEQIGEWIFKLIRTDAIDFATLRVLIVGGLEPILFVTAAPILEYPQSMYDEGVYCTVYEGERFMPQCKTSNLLLNYLALEDSKRRGGFEALLIDGNGCIREGTRSNFYGFRDNILHTAPLEMVLDGITRQSVLKATAGLGIKVIEKAIEYDNLEYYDEVFISATSMAAMPIRQIEGLVFPGDHKRTLELCRIVRNRELDSTI